MSLPVSRVKRFPLNRTGRDFIVGDLHGSFGLLQESLARIEFDTHKDRLFSVGDIIDRGRLSHQCLEFLRQPNVYAVRGNHEDMLLGLYAQGLPSEETLHYVTNHNGLEWWREVAPMRRSEILTALRALPFVIEVETSRGPVGVVHAQVPAGMAWQRFCLLIEAGDPAAIEQALWGRSRVQAADTSGVPGVGRVFVGHTPQFEGLARYGNVYAIDTGAVFGAERGHAGFHLTVANMVSGTAPLTERRAAGLLDTRTAPGVGPFGHYVVKNPSRQ